MARPVREPPLRGGAPLTRRINLPPAAQFPWEQPDHIVMENLQLS